MGEIIGFKDKYTTKSRKVKDPQKEKDKVEISEDSYPVCELLELLINTTRNK